jgi:hypothetical protein
MGSQKLLTALERSSYLKANTSRTLKYSGSVQKGKKKNQVTEIVITESDTNECENKTKKDTNVNESKQVDYNNIIYNVTKEQRKV